MPWVREGECSQCGQCCIEEMQWKPMLNEKGICLYLESKGDGYICKIQANLVSLQDIPKEHYEYWLNECKGYPDPTRPAHTPDRRHHLPENCTYKIYWSDE